MSYELFNVDCLQHMRNSNMGKIVTITDPPYGVDLGNHEGGKETRPGLLVKSGGYLDTVDNFIKVVVPAITDALYLSERGLVFCVPPTMWKLPAPDAIGGVFVPGAVGRNKWGWSTMIHALLYGVAPDLQLGAKPTAIKSNATAEKTGHPTTKPLQWMRWAVMLASRPGDTIFDPFMGSGTTGVAAVQLGRNFIGCEIDPAYFEIAKERIHNATLQPQLFQIDAPKETVMQGGLL